MSKFISLVLCLALVFAMTQTIFAGELKGEKKGTYTEVPKEEYYAAIQKEIDQALQKAIELDKKKTAVSTFATLDVEYRTYLHEDKAKITYRDDFAAGQLAGGYRGNGSLYYTVSGGTSYTLTATFGLPWGSVSVAGSTGKGGANSSFGQSEPLPSNLYYYKLRLNKGYRSVPYSIQKRYPGQAWQTFSTGVASQYHNVYAYCQRVN